MAYNMNKWNSYVLGDELNKLATQPATQPTVAPTDRRAQIEALYKQDKSIDDIAAEADAAWLKRQEAEKAEQAARPWYDKLAGAFNNENGMMDSLRAFSETMKGNVPEAQQYQSRYSELIANKTAEAKEEKKAYTQEVMDRYFQDLKTKLQMNRDLLSYDMNQDDNARALEVAKIGADSRQYAVDNKQFAPQQPSSAVVKQNAADERQARIDALVNRKSTQQPQQQSSGRKLTF